MRLAIMQPTYLPWSGYFGLMSVVDTFVILDSVQFAKRSWQQRNQIKTSHGPLWLTVPVETKGKRAQLINEVRIKRETDYAKDHCKTIKYNYSKSEFFGVYYDELSELLSNRFERLLDLNIEICRYLCIKLKLDCNFIYASALNIQGSKDQLLASICKELQANEYISPPGSSGYLKESKEFSNINVPVKYFNYNHPTYQQLYGDFLSHMSVIDMIMCCGSEKSSELIKAGSSILP